VTENGAEEVKLDSQFLNEDRLSLRTFFAELEDLAFMRDANGDFVVDDLQEDPKNLAGQKILHTLYEECYVLLFELDLMVGLVL
jgi:hypothetical protein